MLVEAVVSAQQPVFRAGAQTVSVYATVRDRDGHLVPGLTKADFQVLDDGRPATITTFANDVLPATLALLLDMSSSMTGEHLRVRDSALQFVNALLPDDRVRIGTFGDEVALSPWLTSDKAILGRVLREEVWPGGSTPLWSAMRAGMASIASEPGRRVVLALSDGIDTGCPRLIGGEPEPPPVSSSLREPLAALAATAGKPDSSARRLSAVAAPIGAIGAGGRRSLAVRSDLRSSSSGHASVVRTTPARFAQSTTIRQPAVRCGTFAEVEKLALDAEFLIYAIGMEGPGLTGGLVKLANDSGGGHFELKRNEDLAAAFHDVAEELHHQYAVGFTPVALDGRIHPLEVRLATAGLTARARKSYVAVDR